MSKIYGLMIGGIVIDNCFTIEEKDICRFESCLEESEKEFCEENSNSEKFINL